MEGGEEEEEEEEEEEDNAKTDRWWRDYAPSQGCGRRRSNTLYFQDWRRYRGGRLLTVRMRL